MMNKPIFTILNTMTGGYFVFKLCDLLNVTLNINIQIKMNSKFFELYYLEDIINH